MKTKIILEVGYNHNGSIKRAKELIDEAAKLKVWGVKFQKWDVEGFPDDIKKMKRNDKNAFGKTYYQHRKYLELTIGELQGLKDHAEMQGLKFMCSGKDFVSVKQLVEGLECKYIKLPSQRYHNNEIFKYLYKERKKRDLFIIVSTGMMKENEIYKSRWADKDGADVIMHCVSLYPAKPTETNMMVMKNSIINGYSSHEHLGHCIPYAVAMGGEYIERHFTLNKSDKGTDHKVSSDPDDILDIQKTIEYVESLLGDKRILTEQEKKHRAFYRGF